ncbi:hypothetical protein M3Y97_00931300 [Aphelenchoides bicaudatus]|nr:hypothetical protein M3Y97_00931300 [Aphelenchoides bicaudatus]
MFNRHLRPPGLIFTGPGGGTMSSKSSTTSTNSLPTRIHASPCTSRPDELSSLISDVEDDQFGTPPAHPINRQDVRFYVEPVSEHPPRQKNSLYNGSNSNSTTSTSRRQQQQPVIAAFVASSSRTFCNEIGASGSNGTPPGASATQPLGKPLTRSSLPGSVPRCMETSSSIQAQVPYPNNAYAPFHDLHNFARYNPAVPIGFDYQQTAASMEPLNRHRGELALHEKYRYDLSKAQLKASSRTSALLAGFAMVALVELQYEKTTPHWLFILLAIVTTLLVSVHLLSLMISTCLLPYIEANGCTQDSPHIRLSNYIELSWIFSTCIGLILFLLEIVIIFIIKFDVVEFPLGGYITTALLVPVLIVFAILSWLIHRQRFSHSVERANNKVVDLEKFIDENELHNQTTQTKNSSAIIVPTSIQNI